MSALSWLFGRSEIRSAHYAVEPAPEQKESNALLEALLEEFPELDRMTPADIAGEFRTLYGLKIAVMGMGFDPAKLAPFANSGADAVWKSLLFRAMLLNDDALRAEGVSESGVISFHTWRDSLR